MLKTEHYCITRANIAAHELIGLRVRITQSSDESRNGISGTVVDETKNTLTIESSGKEILAPKAECEFEFELGDEWVFVEGKKIMHRPEMRLKLWRN